MAIGIYLCSSCGRPWLTQDRALACHSTTAASTSTSSMQMPTDHPTVLIEAEQDRRQLNERVSKLEQRTLRGSAGRRVLPSSTSILAGSTQTVDVTFDWPMTTALYVPLVSLDSTSMSLLGALSVVYPLTNKTVSGCTVTVKNSSALAVGGALTVQVFALETA